MQMKCEVRYVMETGQTWGRQVMQTSVEKYHFALDIVGGMGACQGFVEGWTPAGDRTLRESPKPFLG